MGLKFDFRALGLRLQLIEVEQIETFCKWVKTAIFGFQDWRNRPLYHPSVIDA